VDATYTILSYPEATFDWSGFGGNAHGFNGIERELITATLDWLRPRVPAVDEFTTGITFPAAEAGNYAPYAAAGPDLASTTSTAALDGRGSQDLDGVLTYQWTQVEGPEVAFDDVTSATPTVTAGSFGMNAATLRLTVTDDDGASSTDDVVVTLDGGAAPVDAVDPGRNDEGGSSLDLVALLALALAAARRR
jgi:hypothetical protein